MSRRRSRPRYVLAVLVLAAVTLVTLDDRGNGSGALHGVRNSVHSALSSLQSGIHDALRPAGNFLTGAVDYGSLRSENTRLRAEVAQVQSQQAETEYTEKQYEQVLRHEGIDFAAQYRTVVATVTNQSSSNFEATVTISKGTSSGVAEGEPVVTPAGLAGQVTLATAHSATITLISDPDLSVGVALAGGQVGTAVTEDGSLDVQVIGSAPKVKKGAILYTSSVSPEFPPGIPVGRVTSVSGGESPTITARPFARTGNLSYVSVMLTLPR